MKESGADKPPNEAESQHFLERYGWAIAAVIVALGFVIRLRGLADFWLNPDEGIYYSTLTSAEFGEFWAEVMANAHPPVFYLLLRGFGYLTWDFVWLRATSLLFGTWAIWIFWLIGRELGGKGRAGAASGLIAAGLLALSPDAIAFSQVLRPYMLLLALLGGALVHLLRYGSEPTDRNLVLYLVFTNLALLTHYGAVLALGVFAAVVAHYYVTGALDRGSWERLAGAQAIPAAVLAVLFLQHLDSAINSGPIVDALEPGGWLADWLVASPADAWKSYVAFHNLHFPTDYQGRSALLLLAAVGVSALSRERIVALLVGSALLVALVASYVGLYPFGPSRHNTWLLAFTLPAYGWLAGWVSVRGRAATLAAVGIVAGAGLFGGSLEGLVGAYPLRGNAAEERAIRRQDLAPLVVDRLSPDAEPRIILMSFQTYNLLMPLYASDRRNLSPSSALALFSFPYGSRHVVVAGQWDWNGMDDVRQVVRSLPERLPEVASGTPDRILLLAGGWGSTIFESIEGLEQRGAVVDMTGVLGRDPLGRLLLRLVALDVDMQALEAAS